MTLGEVFDALREDLDDFEAEQVHDRNLSLDEDVEDIDVMMSDLKRFLVRKMNERTG